MRSRRVRVTSVQMSLEPEVLFKSVLLRQLLIGVLSFCDENKMVGR